MNQQKMQILKNSYRKSSIKQEILPQIQPIMRPTRDTAVQIYTNSLNIKQQLQQDTSIYEKKIKLLQQQIEDYQLEHQANIVYNKQFKVLGKLFGNQQMDFQLIKFKIQDSILSNNRFVNTPDNNQCFLLHSQHGNGYTEDQYGNQNFLQLSTEELKTKLINANKSQLLNILQLGSQITMENQTAEQKKKRIFRQAFYEVWQQLKMKDQQSKLLSSEIKITKKNADSFSSTKLQQTIYELKEQIRQKNNQITQLEKQLQKQTNLFRKKQSRSVIHKDSFQLIDKQCEYLTHQNQDLKQEVVKLKKIIQQLQEKMRENQNIEHKKENVEVKYNQHKKEVQLLKEQLNQIKLSKQKQCKNLLTKIEQLLFNTNKYDETIINCQLQKNTLTSQLQQYKIKNQNLIHQLKQYQYSLNKQANENKEIKNIIKQKQQQKTNIKIQYLQHNNLKIQQINHQLILIKQQFDLKQKYYQSKIEEEIKFKQQLVQKYNEVIKQNQTFRERVNNDTQTNTAVFRESKVSEDQKNYSQNQRIIEFQSPIYQSSYPPNNEPNHKQNTLNISKQLSKTKKQQQLLIQIQSYKNEINNLQIMIAGIKTQNKLLHQQIQSLRGSTNYNSPSASQNVQEFNGKVKGKYQLFQGINSKIYQYQQSNIYNKTLIDKLKNYEQLIKQFEQKFQKCITQQNTRNAQLQQIQSHYISQLKNLQNQLKITTDHLTIKDKQLLETQEQFNKLQIMLTKIQTDYTGKCQTLNKIVADQNDIISQLNYKYKQLYSSLQHQKKSPKSSENLPSTSPPLIQQPQIKQLEQIKLTNTQLIKKLNKIQLQQKNKILQLHQSQLKIAQQQNIINSLKIKIKYFQENNNKFYHQQQQLIMVKKQLYHQKINQQQNQKYHQQIQQMQISLQKLQNGTNQLKKLLQQKQAHINKLQLQTITTNTTIQNLTKQTNYYKHLSKQNQQKIQLIQLQLNTNKQIILKKDHYISQITATLGSHIQTLDNMGKQMINVQQNYDALVTQNNITRKQYQITLSKHKQSIEEISSNNMQYNKLNQSLSNTKEINQMLKNQNNELKQTVQNLKNQLSQSNKIIVQTDHQSYQSNSARSYNHKIDIQTQLKPIQQVGNSSQNSIINSIQNTSKTQTIQKIEFQTSSSKQQQRSSINIGNNNSQFNNQTTKSRPNIKDNALGTSIIQQQHTVKRHSTFTRNSQKFKAMMEESKIQEQAYNHQNNMQQNIVYDPYQIHNNDPKIIKNNFNNNVQLQQPVQQVQRKNGYNIQASSIQNNSHFRNSNQERQSRFSFSQRVTNTNQQNINNVENPQINLNSRTSIKSNSSSKSEESLSKNKQQLTFKNNNLQIIVKNNLQKIQQQIIDQQLSNGSKTPSYLNNNQNPMSQSNQSTFKLQNQATQNGRNNSNIFNKQNGQSQKINHQQQSQLSQSKASQKSQNQQKSIKNSSQNSNNKKNNSEQSRNSIQNSQQKNMNINENSEQKQSNHQQNQANTAQFTLKRSKSELYNDQISRKSSSSNHQKSQQACPQSLKINSCSGNDQIDAIQEKLYAQGNQNQLFLNKSPLYQSNGQKISQPIQNASRLTNSQGRVSHPQNSTSMDSFNDNRNYKTIDTNEKIITQVPKATKISPIYSAVPQTSYYTSTSFGRQDSNTASQNNKLNKSSNQQSQLFSFQIKAQNEGSQQSNPTVIENKESSFKQSNISNDQFLKQADNIQKTALQQPEINTSNSPIHPQNQQTLAPQKTQINEQNIGSSRTMSAMSKIISGSKPVVYLRNSTSSFDNQYEEGKQQDYNNGELLESQKGKKDIANSNKATPDVEIPLVKYGVTQNQSKKQIPPLNSNINSPIQINSATQQSNTSIVVHNSPIQGNYNQTLIRKSGIITNTNIKQTSQKIQEKQNILTTNIETPLKYTNQPFINSQSQHNKYPQPIKIMKVQTIQASNHKKLYQQSPNVINSYLISGPKIITPQVIPMRNQVSIISPPRQISPPIHINQKRININPNFVPRQFSPIQVNPCIISPPKQVIIRQISPNSSSQSINSQKRISPPIVKHHQPTIVTFGNSSGIQVNKKMFDTFNLNYNKKTSIYTSKPIIQKIQSNQSQLQRSSSLQQRSFSPSSSSKNMIQQCTEVSAHSNLSVLKNSRLGLPIIPSQTNLQKNDNQRQTKSIIVKDNTCTNQNNSGLIIIEPITPKHAQSLETKLPKTIFYQRKIQPVQPQLFNNVGYTPVRNSSPRTVSNINFPQNQRNQVYRTVVSMKTVSPFTNSPTTVAYGMDNIGTRPIINNQPTIKQNTSPQIKTTSAISYKYSSKPTITQTIYSPKAQPYQTLTSSQYINPNQQIKTNKKQMREEVFSSKHKIIQPYDDSNSSGIQVQQKNNNLECCDHC